VDEVEDIRSDESLKLTRGKGWVFVEDCVDLEQRPEDAVRNPHDARGRAEYLIHRAHEIDVVDLLDAGDGVCAGRFVLQRADNDVAEIADIQRLTDIAAAARN